MVLFLLLRSKMPTLTSFTPSINSSSYYYYNSTKHTIDVCWKNHGYPEWYKLKQIEMKNKKSTQISLTDITTPAFAF